MRAAAEASGGGRNQQDTRRRRREWRVVILRALRLVVAAPLWLMASGMMPVQVLVVLLAAMVALSGLEDDFAKEQVRIERKPMQNRCYWTRIKGRFRILRQ